MLASTLTPARVVYRQGDRLPALRLRPGASDCGETFVPSDYTTWVVTLAGPVTVIIPATLDAATGEVVAPLGASDLSVPGTYLATVTAQDGGLPRTWPSDGGTEVVVAPVLT